MNMNGGNEHENFVKFSGAVDRRHGPVLDNSGASMLHITGAKGVFFCECVDIDRASGLLMQLVSMPVNKVLQSFFHRAMRCACGH